MKHFNASYSGRVCEYEQPPLNANAIFDGSKPPKRTFKHTTKTKNKIKDAFYKMLDYKKGQILFLTFTYQCPLGFRLTPYYKKNAELKNTIKKRILKLKGVKWSHKKSNEDFSKIRKYLNNGKYTKKNPFILNSHCGVYETTKLDRPHYHVLIDLTYKKNLHSNYWSNNMMHLKKIQKHWNTITGNKYKNSVHCEVISKKDFENSKRIYELCSYFTKYFSKGIEDKEIYENPITFISNNIRTKPITIKNNHFLHGISVDLYSKRIDFSKFKRKNISQNPYFTDNAHSKYDSEVYFVNPKLKTELSLYNIYLYEPKGLYESLLIAKISVFVMKYIYNLSIDEKRKKREFLQAEKEQRIKKNKKDQLKIKNFLYIES
jgi:hypothetical protein